MRSAPEDSAALLRLGVARGAGGRLRRGGARVLRRRGARARPREPPPIAFYDLGVAPSRAAISRRARDAFFDAIALAPDDRRAQFNLEWTLRALATRPPPADERQAQEPKEETKPGERG